MASTISVNSGAIVLSAPDNPLSILGGVTVSSASGAAVYGGNTQAWTVTNQGTLTASSGSSVYFQAGGTVTNSGTAASIIGSQWGVAITHGSASVTNQGTISGGSDAVLFASGYTNRLAIDPGAVFSGTVDGGNAVGSAVASTLELASGVSAGAISGLATQYIDFAQITIDAGADWTLTGSVVTAATLTNAGTLGSSVTLAADASVTNAPSATISAGYGVFATGNAATVTNYGTISGSSGIGAELRAGGVVMNAGSSSMLSGSLDGIYAYNDLGAASPTVITNQGTISGTYFDGIFLGPGGTVTNAGSIHGGTDAVLFAAGYASRLIVDPGAVFSGTVDGGNAVGSKFVSALELASGAASGTITGLGAQYINFAQVTIDAGSQWCLQGSNSLAADATLSNAGTLALANATLIAGSLSGTGSISIGAGSTLDAQGTVGSGQAISFAGATGRLILDAPAAMSGNVAELAGAAAIDLAGVIPNSVTFSSGTLNFIANGKPASFGLAVPDGNVTAVTDGSGGALVSALCFCAGTRVATPAGEVPVEELSVGDPVLTASGAVEKLVWIGTSRMMVARGRRSQARPVIVRRDALADNVPNRDLHITKGHSLLLEGVLIPVEFLVNHRTIEWDDRAHEATLYHLELAAHDVLVANGAFAESYRDDGNRWLFQNANTGWHLPAKPPCAPVLTGGPIVNAIWHWLLERAGPMQGLSLTDDPDLHLLVDGRRVDAIERRDATYAFRLPGKPRAVRIRSRAAEPQALGLRRDARMLGVAVRRIVLAEPRRHHAIEAETASLADGYHAFEPDNGIRWTDGDALVPAKLFAGMTGPAMLMLHLGGATRYLDAVAVRRAA